MTQIAKAKVVEVLDWMASLAINESHPSSRSCFFDQARGAVWFANHTGLITSDERTRRLDALMAAEFPAQETTG